MFTYRIFRGKYHLTWTVLLYLVHISHAWRINLSKDAAIRTEDVLLEFLTKIFDKQHLNGRNVA